MLVSGLECHFNTSIQLFVREDSDGLLPMICVCMCVCGVVLYIYFCVCVGVCVHACVLRSDIGMTFLQTTVLLQLLIFDIRFASKQKIVIIVRGIGNVGIEFLIN